MIQVQLSVINANLDNGNVMSAISEALEFSANVIYANISAKLTRVSN